MKIKTKLDIQKRHILLFFLWFFMIALLFLSIVFAFEFHDQLSSFNKVVIQDNLLREVQISNMNDALNDIILDSVYLKNQYQSHRYNSDYDVFQGWRQFLSINRNYYKVSLTDRTGAEIRNSIFDAEALPQTVALKLKQTKRYEYVKTLSKIKENEVYLSYYENYFTDVKAGRCYPILQVLVPIFNENKSFDGALIIHVDIYNLLKTISKSTLFNAFTSGIVDESGHILYLTEIEEGVSTKWYCPNKTIFDYIDLENWQAITLNNQEEAFSNSSGIVAKRYDIENELNNQFDVRYPVFVKSEIESLYFVTIVKDQPTLEIYFLQVDKIMGYIFKKYIHVLIIIFIAVTIFIYTRYRYALKNLRTLYHATIDDLTGFYNRREGLIKLKKLVPENEMRRAKHALCYVDINDLKEVNDTLGHEIGDDLIVNFSSILKQSIREEDFVIRMGGDEIIIVFVNISGDEAERIWSRILGHIKMFNQQENKAYKISASHGIAEYNHTFLNIKEWITVADKRMYFEKEETKRKN